MCILCEPKYPNDDCNCVTRNHIIDPNTNIEIVQLEYSDEGFYIEDDTLGCTVEAGFAGDWIPINFCPICGKQLEHKVTK